MLEGKLSAIQWAGLGPLAPNTLLMGWPWWWRSDPGELYICTYAHIGVTRVLTYAHTHIYGCLDAHIYSVPLRRTRCSWGGRGGGEVIRVSYIYIWVYMYAMYVYMRMHVYVCVCTHVHICTYVYIGVTRVFTFANPPIDMYT